MLMKCSRLSADLAQLVEHILGKDEVVSSSLIISSNFRFAFERTVIVRECRKVFSYRPRFCIRGRFFYAVFLLR